MDSVPTIFNSTINADGAAPLARVPIQTLDQEDFLKLLIAQMTTQDPLNPKADLDSITQMAQFSALEQSRATQSEISRLRDAQQILQANGMLGHVVELQLDKETTVRGVVDAVQIEAGTPRIVVNGHSYDLNKLLTVALAEPQQ